MALEEGIAMICDIAAGLFFCRRLRSHAESENQRKENRRWPLTDQFTTTEP